MKSQFTEGPVLPQLFKMMLVTWIAMSANIVVVVVDMYFLSYLKNEAVLAAVGFASSLMFISASLGIGLSVATGVLVSQALGRDGKTHAAQSFSAIFYFAFTLAALMVAVLLPFMGYFVQWLGAEQEPLSLAVDYLWIVFPTAPFAVLSMVIGAALRSIAAAKASMLVAISVAVANLILDPIFIFVLDYGLNGAAMATAISRVLSVVLGVSILSREMGLLHRLSFSKIAELVPKITTIAFPTILTNMFTPVGSLIAVTYVAKYGTQAVAGQALVGSISPLLFSVYFSLTGAAGPIVGQNIGANKPERVAEVYRKGVMVLLAYTLFVWAVLAYSYPMIIKLYHIDGLAAELIRVYCLYQIPLFAGLGILALSNGIFNNLQKPLWATWFNGIRSTIVTLAFCMIGAKVWGVFGVVIGSTLTFPLFGLLTFIAAQRLFHTKYPHVALFFHKKSE